jgi:hypothetical protein
MERAELWADALGLAGSHRQRFLDLAAIAHMPESVQSRYIAILDGFERADAREQAQQSFIHELEARIASLESKAKRRGK